MHLTGNPFRQALRVQGLHQPWDFVLFGATGDLARRKILPSLYGLFHFGLASNNLKILAFASRDTTEEGFRQLAAESVKKFSTYAVDNAKLEQMLSAVGYVRRTSDRSASYLALADRLRQVKGAGRLFFMAVPAEAAVEHAHELAASGVLESGTNRIVVEKPFGRDRQSSADLNDRLLQAFPESDIYRIDHYLGKETVQNILVIRFANQFLEPLLNCQHIEHIQITIAETVGVENRGAFYDSIGALRDIIQNHALQMLALLTMEMPDSLNSEDIRRAKTELLRSIYIPEPLRAAVDSATGRYAGSTPYLSEPGVSADSRTETFAAIKLSIPNLRWQQVPFFIRTGKKLAKRATAITIAFRETTAFKLGELAECRHKPNYLTIRVQPNEGASLTLQTKLPGEGFATRPVTMDFHYDQSIAARVPEAYERLILDAMMGDRTNFASAEEIDLMWGICEPFIQGWQISKKVPKDYIPGTWGPASADRLIQKEGARWKRL